MTEARNIAHLLAGTAGMVGKEALGDIAFDVETRIAAGIGSKSSVALVGAADAIEDLIVALDAPAVSPPLKVRKG